MANPFKKVYPIVPGLLIAVTGQVNGDDCNSLPYEPSCCEIQNCEPCCYIQKDGLHIRGELLYWRAELCGLESAFGNTVIETSLNDQNMITTTVTESDEEPDCEWNAGFRVGAGYGFTCFDLEADWTHYDGGAKFRDGRQHGHWKIKYDVVDVTLGRYFSPTPCFYWRPFIGVRCAWIHQSLKSHLEVLFTSIIGDNTVFTDMDDSEHFWGIGPQFGLEGDWCLGCNFSLYGSLAVVTYYGHVKGKNFDTDTFTSTVSICNGKRKHCFDSIGTDLALGIRWDKAWCCSCYEWNLMLKLGLEQHRIYDFSNLGSDGTLSLDGGIFAVGIGFSY